MSRRATRAHRSRSEAAWIAGCGRGTGPLRCIKHHPVIKAVTLERESQPCADDDEQVKVVSGEGMWGGIKDAQRAIDLARAKHHGHAEVGANVKG